MLRNFIILSFITLVSFTSNGQSNNDLEKFQTIAARNSSEIVVAATDDEHYSFGDNTINETSVIVKIAVASETFPTRILRAMIEQGDFNVKYKVSNGKIILSHLKKSQEIRYEGKTHKIDFSYEILVPMSLAYEN